MVLGRAVYGASALIRGLASLPLMPRIAIFWLMIAASDLAVGRVAGLGHRTFSRS